MRIEKVPLKTDDTSRHSERTVLAWFSPAGIPRAQCEQFVLSTARGAISAVSFEDAYALAPNGSLRVNERPPSSELNHAPWVPSRVLAIIA